MFYADGRGGFSTRFDIISYNTLIRLISHHMLDMTIITIIIIILIININAVIITATAASTPYLYHLRDHLIIIIIIILTRSLCFMKGERWGISE